MRELSLFRTAILALFLGVGLTPAHAQTTPQQIQAMIANGQENAALGALSQIIQVHPNSGVAWYLTAEAQDAAGNEAAASAALTKAEQLTPGLPFAKPDDVAALQAHLAAAPVHHGGLGGGHIGLIIGGFVLLFLVLRFFNRARRGMAPFGYGGGFQNGPMDRPPYNPGGMPYNPGMGAPGGGMGSSLLSGLAAGAGFAAGERIFDGLMGGGDRAANPQPDNNFGPAPDRDDGLNGAPGWDNSGSSDNSGDFDQNNSW